MLEAKNNLPDARCRTPDEALLELASLRSSEMPNQYIVVPEQRAPSALLIEWVNNVAPLGSGNQRTPHMLVTVNRQAVASPIVDCGTTFTLIDKRIVDQLDGRVWQFQEHQCYCPLVKAFK
uniref:Uncharacterized protein n=1 Tax=Romanomermis culicivorax TaxID=13658 RepID=A0A915HQM2_ROMCU